MSRTLRPLDLLFHEGFGTPSTPRLPTLVGGSAPVKPAVKGRVARLQALPLTGGEAGAIDLDLSAGARTSVR